MSAYTYILCTLLVFFVPITASYRARFKARKLAQSTMLSFRLGDCSTALPESFTSLCLERYGSLNNYNNSYFNTAFLRQPHKVRSFLLEQETKEDRALLLKIRNGNYDIPVTYFDRHSDKVVFICGGFTNPREYMAPFIKLYPHYDLVFFDLPGHGLDYESPQGYKGQISKSLCGVNTDAVTLGQAEVITIQSVVALFRKQRRYTKSCAVARCYSVPFFAQAGVVWQENHVTPLFDSLIIDSAFTSFAEFIPHFPRLFFSWIHMPLLHNVTQSWIVQKSFSLVAHYFLPKNFETTPSVASLLNKLTSTDMLFFHSLKDVAISNEDFESLWHNTGSVVNKVAIFTHNRHAMNHIKQKEMYALVTSRFIDMPFEGFCAQMMTYARGI